MENYQEGQVYRTADGRLVLIIAEVPSSDCSASIGEEHDSLRVLLEGIRATGLVVTEDLLNYEGQPRQPVVVVYDVLGMVPGFRGKDTDPLPPGELPVPPRTGLDLVGTRHGFDWQELPRWLRHVARDIDGAWCAFEHRPVPGDKGYWAAGGRRLELPPDYSPFFPEVEWKDTLMTRHG